MRSLVTGGAGFIGSNLVDALVARGDQVFVIDDLSSGNLGNLDDAIEHGATLVEADIRDSVRISEEVARIRPERVFHLAAQIDVRRSVSEPSFDAEVNVVGTVNVLESCAKAGGSRFVFASTGGAIYGEGAEGNLPFRETLPPRPLSPYAQSKLTAEGYVDLFRRVYGVSGCSLRLANVYGPRQDPHGEAGVVAIFCSRLRDRLAPVIYGDGSQTRDYVFVDDVVAAMLAAADHDFNGVLNIGTSVQTSVADLLDSLRSISGAESPGPEFEDPRAGEVERSSIDSTKAGEVLGWSPSTSLERGLALTFEALSSAES